MNTINPISNPDDIRKEVENTKNQEKQHDELLPSNEATMPDSIENTPQTRSLQPIDTTSSSEQESQVDPQPQSNVSSPQAIEQTSGSSSIYPEMKQTPQTSLESMPVDINYNFEYPLPLSSYILSLLSAMTFYTTVVMPIISILAIMSSFGASASLSESSVENLFSLEALKEYGPLLSFLFLSVFLITPKRWARWAAIGVAAGILLYGVYQIVTLNDQSAGFMLQTARETSPQMYMLLFFGVLPYVIAPLATIPYLMMPKARRAYS